MPPVTAELTERVRQSLQGIRASAEKETSPSDVAGNNTISENIQTLVKILESSQRRAVMQSIKGLTAQELSDRTKLVELQNTAEVQLTDQELGEIRMALVTLAMNTTESQYNEIASLLEVILIGAEESRVSSKFINS